jgi:hypothetical protein
MGNEVYRLKLSDDDAYQYFRNHKQPDHQYNITISYICPGGKKSVWGLHVNFVNTKQYDGYSTDQFTMDTPCVRIPMVKHLPPSRKQFLSVVAESIERWKERKAFPEDHPFWVAIDRYYRRRVIQVESTVQLIDETEAA